MRRGKKIVEVEAAPGRVTTEVYMPKKDSVFNPTRIEISQPVTVPLAPEKEKKHDNA